MIMALMILLFLPSFPFSASFLTPRERAIAQARLDRDHKPQSHGGMTGWQGFKVILADPNAWLFVLIYGSCKELYNTYPSLLIYDRMVFNSQSMLEWRPFRTSCQQ